jgi:hypothetical protein
MGTFALKQLQKIKRRAGRNLGLPVVDTEDDKTPH